MGTEKIWICEGSFAEMEMRGENEASFMFFFLKKSNPKLEMIVNQACWHVS